ncbi:Non-LTR retroelement reverse transcriptase-like [Theobroma cacao]|uniref:Non-LTR retroelement reverse transcriptase-like n=1 Tax=Theobroma cacao TaxID=3641 RepID=A0A061EPN9_THECC|nr:Non-LTR retroelement reverse transcriptase-like [Theobroma cacao]
MSVTAKSTDSLLWKSILKSRVVLEKGLRMNITNGQKAKFWTDNWLRCGPLCSYAINPLSEMDLELPVASFCDEVGNWDMQILEQELPRNIILMILAVKLDPTSEEGDTSCWIPSSDGRFSIKSTYDLQRVDSFDAETHWSYIWKTVCTRKVKVFIWRILHESLPTLVWLLIEMNLWLQIDPTLINGSFFSLDLKSWIMDNVRSVDILAGIPWSIIFMYSLWLIWYWRNLFVFYDSFNWSRDAWQQIWTKSKEAWDFLKREHDAVKKDILISWELPKHSYVKLNVDGSAKGQPGMAAAGGVIRYEVGNWLLGFNYKIGISCSLQAELWALYWGLTLCWDKGFRKVQVESDSLLAVQKISNQSLQPEQNAGLLKCIKELFQRFWNCTLTHIHREANQCADWMATHHENLLLKLHIMDSPPSSISAILLADSISIFWSRMM